MPFDLEKIMNMDLEAEKQQQATDTASQALQVVQLPIESLLDFPPELHKFKPASGQRLADLVETIRLDGIINALIVRPLSEVDYQIIAGHNRRRAAQELGYRTVPCIVRRLSDDDAIRVMISDNLHNRDLLPSERGWAYRWEMEVSKRQGQRTDLTSSQSGTKFRTDQVIGKEKGDGKSKVRRYIRLTYLIPSLLDLVDEKKMGVTVGEQIASFEIIVSKGFELPTLESAPPLGWVWAILFADIAIMLLLSGTLIFSYFKKQKEKSTTS